jgi:hypothetical protein
MVSYQQQTLFDDGGKPDPFDDEPTDQEIADMIDEATIDRAAALMRERGVYVGKPECGPMGGME